jgi:hypothetical protein
VGNDLVCARGLAGTTTAGPLAYRAPIGAKSTGHEPSRDCRDVSPRYNRRWLGDPAGECSATLRCLPRYFLALLARFRQADRDRLLAALDPAGSAAATASCCAAFIAVHLAFHFGAGAARISALSSLCHLLSSKTQVQCSLAMRVLRPLTTAACAIGCLATDESGSHRPQPPAVGTVLQLSFGSASSRATQPSRPVFAAG